MNFSYELLEALSFRNYGESWKPLTNQGNEASHIYEPRSR